jgi:TetR/AcrR family transcriptional regulator, cholesterol catabolism regulator
MVVSSNERSINMARNASIRSRRAVGNNSRSRRKATGAVAPTRFDQRLTEILAHATEVFDAKGYEGASMRDLSRASGMSLAGLYYYFESKEKLLYLIQRHTFTTILERLKQRLRGVSDPEDRIRVFIGNHLDYFLANQKAMKVLSHEDEVLKNGYGAEIAAIKREYVRICVQLIEEWKRSKGVNGSSRTAALSLFGMMNWIYTWYRPRDGGAEELAREMGDIFLHGLGGGGATG